MTPAFLESSTMALPQQSPPTAITLPPIEVDSQDEFIGDLMEGFYKSLKRCLPMIFKITRTSFAFWRPIFSWLIESIWNVGGISEAEILEELIANLEKDISEWSNLRQLNLTLLVEAKSERLIKQI